MNNEPTPEAEHTEEALDVPVWTVLAAVDPAHLNQKAELLVRLNLRQQGVIPKKIHTYTRRG